MKKILGLLLATGLLFSTLSYGAMELRSYTERAYGYDSNYYTDIGVDARFTNTNAELKLKRGVMFSALDNPISIGNHQWYYNGMEVSYTLINNININANVLTEVNWFEGNDFGETGQMSVQGFGIDVGPISFDNSKWTNSDFYANLSIWFKVEKDFPFWFTETYWVNIYNMKGTRGKADLGRIWDYDPNYIETKLVHWWKIPLSEDLVLSLRGSYLIRQMLTDATTNVGWTISVGLIAN